MTLLNLKILGNPMNVLNSTPYARSIYQSSRWLGWIIGLLASIPAATASTFDIRPIPFGNGITATGTITTDGNTNNIIDWNLTVTTRERLARFTPASTPVKGISQVSVSSDGRRMEVATSNPVSGDGGQLFFRSPNPFQDVGVAVADFTGENANTGQAFYMNGGAFDFLSPLVQTTQTDYVAATASSSGSDVFNLVPLQFTNGVTMSGTLKTDGTLGEIAANNVSDWDIVVDQITEDIFKPSNSELSASAIGLSTSGQFLTVKNPNGSLSFIKGYSGGHPYSLMLADFTDGSYFYGQAGYFQGSQAFYTVDLNAPLGPWTVGRARPDTAVPEPSATLALTLAGLGSLVAFRTK
jgi:hypothetical protein